MAEVIAKAMRSPQSQLAELNIFYPGNVEGDRSLSCRWFSFRKSDLELAIIISEKLSNRGGDIILFSADSAYADNPILVSPEIDPKETIKAWKTNFRNLPRQD